VTEYIFSLTAISEAITTSLFEEMIEGFRAVVRENQSATLSLTQYEPDQLSDNAVVTPLLAMGDDKDQFFSDDNTLLKVRVCLMQHGMTETEALDAINDMQNKGILFRERH